MQDQDAKHILLIEDDPKLSKLVREYLEINGFTVSVEMQGDRAEERILEENPDLVILDIMLPGKDGRSICRDVRPHFDGPILMLTALVEDADQIVGLEIGADDYLSKPVKPRLLLSRINALLRRTVRLREMYPEGSPAQEKDETPLRIAVNSLVVDAGNRTVAIDEESIPLSTAEFDLLLFPAQHPGEVLSRNRLYRATRGIDYDGVDRSIDLRIARLRRKLGDDARCPRLIKSIHGEGYLLVMDS